MLFQSTRPAWGATLTKTGLRRGYDVSIHAPRVGRDKILRSNARQRDRFNPRAPRGARHVRKYDDTGAVCVSIHAPRVGRDA